ncbi:MAG: hypothetical protein DRI61_14800 [Chloroflexi bacterium]|nr:MAG: hypothetical protein DRI61_14800 [Chloroflexota bacterium]
MNVRILERKGEWDVSPYTIEGVGTGFVLRPHPDAGGGAHPRYMRREGFISLSPRLGLDPDKFFSGLPQTFVCELRETKRGEIFLAILSPSAPRKPTHIGFFSFAPRIRGKEGEFWVVAEATDSTATGARTDDLTFCLARVGTLFEEADKDDDPIVYRVTEEGLTILSADEGISAEDLNNLG